MRAPQAVALLVALATSACGQAERRAAEARADSLQRVLQHQQDSLKGARARTTAESIQTAQRQQDSLKAAGARAAAAKRRSDSLTAAREKAVADSVSAERARPRDLEIMNTTGVSVPAGRWGDYPFVLDSAADCLVHGRIEVLSGGEKKDVEVLLLTDDAFTNWKNKQRVRAIFHGGQQTVTTVNTGLSQAGAYRLVVSNAFSVFSGKTVKGQVTVTCHGLQPRQL